MISAWLIAPTIFIGFIVGYIIACFMFISKQSGDNDDSDKK